MSRSGAGMGDAIRGAPRPGTGVAVARAFPLGDLPLDAGPVLAEAVIGYRSWGRLDAEGANAVLLPGHFPGVGVARERLIGPGRALDPDRHFIVATDLFGEGLSSAPSRHPSGPDDSGFPAISLDDNLRAQHRLMTALGVRRISLVAGWSVAGLQSLRWAALWPDLVAAALPICPAAPWLPGTSAALRRSIDIIGAADVPPRERLRALGRVAAESTLTPDYFRDGLFRDDGYGSEEEALADWESVHLGRDPADLALILRGWAEARFGPAGQYGQPAVLGAIRARVILIGGASDRACPPDELARIAAAIPGAESRIMPSPFGHRAGVPGRYPEETALIERAARDLLG